MQYEWENYIKGFISFENIELDLPDNYNVMGFAIARFKNGNAEACLIPNKKYISQSIIHADIWQDVSGDINKIYRKTLRGDRDDN